MSGRIDALQPLVFLLWGGFIGWNWSADSRKRQVQRDPRAEAIGRELLELIGALRSDMRFVGITDGAQFIASRSGLISKPDGEPTVYLYLRSEPLP